MRGRTPTIIITPRPSKRTAATPASTMTWAKLDDKFHAHPKVLEAWREEPTSIGLHVLALSHCAAYLTDGHIDSNFTKTKMPNFAPRRRAIAALINAGLWEANGTGWLIHDYLAFNPSREQVKREQAERSEKARRAARARWDA